MTKEQHRQRHQLLHKHLDELIADYFTLTGNLPSKTTVMELAIWSNGQTENPDNRRTHGEEK